MDFDKFFDDILSDALTKAKELGNEGEAFVKAAETSAQIVAQAGKRLLSGALDQRGATEVAKDGIRQLKQYAVGSTNLAAAGFMGYLEGVWTAIKNLLPV